MGLATISALRNPSNAGSCLTCIRIAGRAKGAASQNHRAATAFLAPFVRSVLLSLFAHFNSTHFGFWATEKQLAAARNSPSGDNN